jgi:hypothetical protein
VEEDSSFLKKNDHMGGSTGECHMPLLCHAVYARMFGHMIKKSRMPYGSTN